ncbi:aldehyde dehydrogenase family protein [Streptosporangium sp. NPDC006007]|uniref:aldehyde dehydrogenase family protein n=1 Tax=Streptosporangium sp. NPDC006007 TaxID=3154575 RepID=UPI0033AD96F3
MEGALFAGFGTAGQRCTSLGTAIVHESVHGEFLARYARAVADAAIGDPAGDVLCGPLLDRRFASRYEEYPGWIQPHHTVVSGPTGRITPENPRGDFTGDGGLYYHPVVVDGVRADDRLFWEETFGPIVGVTGFATLDEAVELAKAMNWDYSGRLQKAQMDVAEIIPDLDFRL